MDELNILRTWFKFLCVDHSCALNAVISWLVFLVFGVLVPGLSLFALSCADCSSKPYDGAAQLSLSVVAILSFICLSVCLQKCECWRFIYVDMLERETVDITAGYIKQSKRSLVILFAWVLPCFAAEVAYKIWRYSHGGTRLFGNVIVSNSVAWVACVVELCSWFYRTMIFLLVCVLFGRICTLQIIRIQHFVSVFCDHSDVQSLMNEHFRIRRHLTIISQRFRLFILGSSVFIIMSHSASLHMIVWLKTDTHIFDIGELMVCYFTLFGGLLIILWSAARITNMAQALTSIASKWHIYATMESIKTRVVSDEEYVPLNEDESEEDERDATISFQHRQALVSYLENNRAGITVFGFTLDITSYVIIYGIELSLTLWLLQETN